MNSLPPEKTRRTLAQLRTNKIPILISYLHKVDETHYPSAPSAKHTHIASIQLHTLIPQATYWMSPERVVPLLARWKGRLAGLP